MQGHKMDKPHVWIISGPEAHWGAVPLTGQKASLSSLNRLRQHFNTDLKIAKIWREGALKLPGALSLSVPLKQKA